MATGLFLFVSLLLGLEAKADFLHSFYGLQSTLSQAHLDPLAKNDSFLSLSSPQKRLLAQSTSDTHSKMSTLLSLGVTIRVTVKLVGFSSEERSQLESQFRHYIDLVSRKDKVKVVSGDNHEFAISTKAALNVELDLSSMAETIYSAIERQSLKPTGRMSVNLQPVNYTVVDEIVREDVPKSATSYYIYLLNLRTQAGKYAYSYQSKEQSPSFSKCLGSLWTGSDRYVWVDLSAGPVEYGPSLSGEGLLPRGDTHPFASLHSDRWHQQKAFIADLASLVWSAIQMLFAPSLRIPAQFETDLEVHFIHIKGLETGGDTKGLDLELIERTFTEASNNGLLLQQQHLKFYQHALKMSSCSTCVAAISQSMRFYTSRYHFENYTLIVSEYLDSKRLHFSLQHSKQDLLTKAGISQYTSGKVVPVYIFDLDHNRPMLLDRFHQAMAFRNMVIAVRTISSLGSSDYTCNSRYTIMQTQRLERPIIGALLQTLWGVTPTHLRWSFQHNSSIIDYTWAVGQTPFGPFSDLTSLSFVQKDAAPRNILFTVLNISISSALDMLQFVEEHGGERKLFGPKRHVEFTQRWNLFRFKLEKALSAISHFEFDNALYHLKSSDHDLIRLYRLVHEASAKLQPSLICFTNPSFSWWPVGIALSISALLLYMWMRREQLFHSKKKQF